jgi:hypothetical protein
MALSQIGTGLDSTVTLLSLVIVIVTEFMAGTLMVAAPVASRWTRGPAHDERVMTPRAMKVHPNLAKPRGGGTLGAKVFMLP